MWFIFSLAFKQVSMTVDRKFVSFAHSQIIAIIPPGHCEQLCGTNAELRKHIDECHRKETVRRKDVPKCPICGLKCADMKLFNKHMKDHLNDGYTPQGKIRKKKPFTVGELMRMR